LCRKPKSLLIEKAIARFGTDKPSSLMIGDKLRDVESAQGAGIKGFQVISNPSYETLMSLILER
jgi:D-glycero-D-manno-heptose 1,7-bisphosphate phosphatase